MILSLIIAGILIAASCVIAVTIGSFYKEGTYNIMFGVFYSIMFTVGLLIAAWGVIND